MARIRSNDTRDGIPQPGESAPGSADLSRWTDKDVGADIKRFVVRYGRVGSKDLTRACSEATITARRQRLHRAFDLLAKANRGVRTLADLRPKHLTTMIKSWDDAGIAPRTQVQIFSVLKWFWRMHGMSAGVGGIKAHSKDPNRYVTRYAAQYDKGVSARVDDIPALFRSLDTCDERIGAFARLAWALGLRRLECIRLHPHEDFTGATLEITRGAKGGRQRSVSLAAAGEARAAVAREAIETLRHVTPRGTHAGWPGKTLQQSVRHFAHLMHVRGLTKAALGATFHGLRHDYSNDRLEQLSGITSPVRGGLCVDYRQLEEHQRLVSKQLGHNRIGITTAYYGSMREMQKLAKHRVLRSWEQLRPGLQGALDILRRHGLRQLYLTGSRAMGTNTDDAAQFDFAVPGADKLLAPQLVLLLRELHEHWHRVLLTPVYVSLRPQHTGRNAAKHQEEESRSQMPLYATDLESIIAAAEGPTKPGSSQLALVLGPASFG